MQSHRMSVCLIVLSMGIHLTSCQEVPAQKENNSSQAIESVPPYQKFLIENPDFHADGFDFPVGKPDAKEYYNAQPFTENGHLGDDWNAVTGGDSDLGDPIYAIGHGFVYSAKQEGPGWGYVIRLIHFHPNQEPEWIESLYAHCDSMLVKEGQAIKKGEQIGTIGNADGAYLAHLHLEIRDSLEMPIGGGYSSDTAGFLDPTAFIQQHRKDHE